jgi:adenosine deaminase
MDLAGNEAEFPAKPFAGVFRDAHQSGLKLTVHAGEWAGAANVREAIEVLGAERIGHGIRVLEDASAAELARERATVFEVCITSNYQTGSVASLKSHPVMKMLDAGLTVTLCTDDPSISRITLTDEYRRACEELGMPLDTLKARILAAADAGFLPKERRTALIAGLKKELKIR